MNMIDRDRESQLEAEADEARWITAVLAGLDADNPSPPF